MNIVETIFLWLVAVAVLVTAIDVVAFFLVVRKTAKAKRDAEQLTEWKAD